MGGNGGRVRGEGGVHVQDPDEAMSVEEVMPDGGQHDQVWGEGGVQVHVDGGEHN